MRFVVRAGGKSGTGDWGEVVAFALPLVLFLAASAYFLAASAHSRYDFPLDDAWIHRVYSRSFAQGDGFAYNPGEQEGG